MKVRLPTIGVGVMLVGATAMLADTGLYSVGESNGDAPDMGKVSLVQSSTNAAGCAMNLQLTATEGLEPNRYNGEVPVMRTTFNRFKLT